MYCRRSEATRGPGMSQALGKERVFGEKSRTKFRQEDVRRDRPSRSAGAEHGFCLVAASSRASFGD
ncbi:hypothetical protein B0H12DRAFT_1152993 [Mycena haematopus]|nr:hypothetical protein B0H12DRAFT_1152993 [Mycena haematopus]